MPSLLEPITIGALELPNRLIMAPLTRTRAIHERVPNDLMLEYYRQRASAGLIISEATSIDPMGVGYPDTPGIWSQAQVEGWKKVTEAVHKAGGKMLLQLWHVGRISHPAYLNGAAPVAPSSIAAKGHVSLMRPEQPYPTPRALALEEIPDIIEQYHKGAENAKAAGFDGVEIHGANGYLLDQFLQDGSNKRTDQYGGSLENRTRFALEVVDAVVSVWGKDRVGMHIAPRGDAQSMGDSNLEETFTYVATELGRREIAFLCAREYKDANWLGPKLKKAFGGVYIANEKFNLESANDAVEAGEVDAVAFGKLYIANPDLKTRFALNAPLNTPDPKTFYASGPEGYTDYPLMEKAIQKQA